MTESDESVSVLLLGFGEAGQAFARGWKQAGLAVDLSTYDIKLESEAAALREDARRAGVKTVMPERCSFGRADLVFSLVTADQAFEAARTASAFLSSGQFYCDCNSVSPATKIGVGRLVRRTGATYLVLALKPLRNQFSSTLSAWVLRGIRNIGCQIAALEVDFKLNFGPETGRSGQISRFGDDSTHLAPGACGQS